MRTLQIIGDNHFDSWNKHRTACRGIVVNGDEILLSYEAISDQYGIPGGGIEGNETLEECCRREIAEETGIVVAVDEKYLTVNEFYEDWFFETHFFICKPIGVTERKMTAREQKVGMIPKWVNIKEAISIFSKHQEYAETDEEKRGIYLREYKALNEFLEETDKLSNK